MLDKVTSEALVTVVMVMQNDQAIIAETLQQTVALLSGTYQYYEILIVDNGSSDSSVEKVKELQRNIPNIRLLVLSRKYDQEIAFSAALDNSLGDYVVLMDIQFDPPAVIPELLAKAQTGYDIVIAERKDRSDNTWTEKIFARLFYKIYGNISGFYFSPNASYFRVMSRRAVNSVIKIKNKSRYLKYFNALVGFTQTYVPYERVYKKDAKQTKDGFVRSIIKALDVIIANTVSPLRIVSLLGILASLLSLLFLAYVLVVLLIKDQVAEGWISSSAMNAVMFFLVFLFLTVISEYISRILVESGRHQLRFALKRFSLQTKNPLGERCAYLE